MMVVLLSHSVYQCCCEILKVECNVNAGQSHLMMASGTQARQVAQKYDCSP